MACGQSFYENNPARDHYLAQQSAQKDEVAIQKVMRYFVTKANIRAIERKACSHTGHTRIEITLNETGMLVRHRGAEFQVSSTDPASLEDAFRQWCRQEMQHAKVLPHKRLQKAA